MKTTNTLFNWRYLINNYRKFFFIVVIVLSALIGIGVSLGKLSIIALGIAVIPMLLASSLMMVNNLQYGPVFILIAASCLPFYLSTGTMSVIVDSFILTGGFTAAWVFVSLMNQKKVEIKKSPVNLPFLGFLVVVPIALVWSIIFRDPLVKTWSSFIFVQAAAALIMMMLPISMLFVGNIVNDIKILKILVWIFLAMGFLGYIYEIRFNLNLYRIFEILRLEIKNGGLFTLWVICLSVGLVLYQKDLPISLRIFLVGLACIWIYYRFWQKITWMTGWLPSLVALGVLMVKRSKKLTIILAVFALTFVIANSEFFMDALFAERVESGGTRLMAWSTSLGLTMKHFLFGTGPGGYAAYYMTYFPAHAMATHNNYLDIIAQTGIVGFIFYIWMFVALFRIGNRLCARVKGRRDFYEGLANGLFAGLIGCIVAMGLGDWMVPFPYTQGIGSYDYIVYSWMFLGAMLALDAMTRPESKKPELVS